MRIIQVSGAVLAATLCLATGAAQGQDQFGDPSAAQGGDQPAESPIPPDIEAAPVPYPTGGFCYAGPHPVDTRVEPGVAFDETQGLHIHNYAPIDLRLFTFKEGCYYFIGDPRDFGYGGQVYNYYGAHPVMDTYGGGWCFMMGGHYHLWQPWSPYFTVVGPWNYWYGPYDPFFWAYWPYYSYYYRSFYPRYYGGGRFYRGGGYGVAPPIRSVPAPAGGWRGAPPAPAASSALHGTAPASPGWHGSPVPTAPAHPYAPVRPSVPTSGGVHFRGGGGRR